MYEKNEEILLKTDMENFKENFYDLISLFNIFNYCIREYLDNDFKYCDEYSMKENLYSMSGILKDHAFKLKNEMINISEKYLV